MEGKHFCSSDVIQRVPVLRSPRIAIRATVLFLLFRVFAINERSLGDISMAIWGGGVNMCQTKSTPSMPKIARVVFLVHIDMMDSEANII
eukprot:scaffold123773_cov49-Attheya_sp.AAC.4